MTCIAGFVENGVVWMGADSAGVAGYALTVRADQKLFRNGPMLFGFTSSFRMGQLLRHALEVPEQSPKLSVEKYMSTVFVDAVRECLKSHGWASKEKEQESGGTFLVAYRGRLFSIQDDYQVAEAADGMDACGCGQDVARGALYATAGAESGCARMQRVLAIAERCSAGVRQPFVVEALDPEVP
jgi:ATP-dependent protease HslVU (ClpYQ) peptidase subunit